MRSLTGQAATCARLKSYADFTAGLAYGRKVNGNLVPSPGAYLHQVYRRYEVPIPS